MLDHLLSDPCSGFVCALCFWALGLAASQGKPALRRLGAALAGAALLVTFFHGLYCRADLMDNLVASIALSLFLQGTCLIVVSLVAFVIQALPARPRPVGPPTKKPEPAQIPEPPLPALPAPPPPPPPTESERMAQAQERYRKRMEIAALHTDPLLREGEEALARNELVRELKVIRGVE